MVPNNKRAGMVAKSNYDLTKLNEMLDGDKEAILNMIKIFNQSTPDLVNQMKDSFENSDLISVSKTAHNLKSSIGVFGIHELVEDFDRLVTLSRTESQPEEISKLIVKVEEVLKVTCQQLDEYKIDLEKDISVR